MKLPVLKSKYQLFGELNRKQIYPFALIACCFALWGFTNDMTSTMASAFSKIFRISVSEGGMAVVANHLGYLVMGLPAAWLIMKYRFKAGVMTGLAVYALGALLFLPAKTLGVFPPFLLAYFTMTCGLAFLETCCHPLVYSMGSEESGIGRLNLVQSFNAMGALVGMFVVRDVIQAGMSPLSSLERSGLPERQFEIIKDHDLGVLIQPYVYIVAVIVILLVVIFFYNPKATINQLSSSRHLWRQVKQVAKAKNYREGVITQFFYVGAQVCCWAYILQYGSRIFLAEGMDETTAMMEAQKYNIIAMAMFAVGRFLCTWLLKYIEAGRLLAVMAIAAVVLTIGIMFFTDRNGLYCLIMVSFCMSLMFATIYGISLRNMGRQVKLASAGMTMAVSGGALFPAFQAAIIDAQISFLGLPATNISFIIPLVCFCVVAVYGHRGYVRHSIASQYYG